MTHFDTKGKFTDERRKRIQALSDQALEDLLLEAAYYSAAEVEFVREELRARKNALTAKTVNEIQALIQPASVEAPQLKPVETKVVTPIEDPPVRSELDNSSPSNLDATPITTFSEAPTASLTEPSQQQTVPSGNAYAQPSYAPSNYGALRGIAALCTILGWIILFLTGLLALLSVQVMFNNLISGLLGVIVTSAVGVFIFIVLRVIAESISVLLDIEANTRRAAVILEQRLK
jgi:hypothetical protein